MALSSGTRVGIYEVTAKIGEGGMGEVYQARDTTLDRDVALKVLPEAFTADPDRLARFQREAKVLASLNHPNIGAIHGLESTEDTQALVLELIEGPTLADRIAEGPIPVDETLAIAKQIADALEAAHEQGIIHRDLKPANVKVKADGTVKVLDFGLAKAVSSDASGASATTSATMSLTASATQMGMVIGTAAYMAPEQAKGKPVDKRADIWAFGVVLLEMLSGKRLFTGETASETLAAVMMKEPNWNRLPENLPDTLDNVLRRCLEKDPRERIRDIGDARLAMKGVFETRASTPIESVHDSRLQFWQSPVPLSLMGVALLTFGGLAVWGMTRPSPTAPSLPTRFAVTVPSSLTIGIGGMVLSPDGRMVVFSATSDERTQLYQRRLGQLEAVPIPGTENAQVPFFSPDGAWVGFFSGSELKKVSLDGRPSVSLFTLSGTRRGASWGDNDMIVFAQGGSSSLWRVGASGGEAEEITVDGAEQLSDRRWVDVLPGGEAALVTVWLGGLDDAQIAIESLDTGEQEILVAGTSPRYVPTGHIVYWREGSIWAVPFDVERKALAGSAAPVVEDVAANTGGLAHFAVAANGSLAYLPGSATGQRTLVWVDREGVEQQIEIPSGTYSTPRVSPDGTRIVTANLSEELDLWTYQIGRGTSQRLTYDPGEDSSPVWTSDGTKVAFRSTGRDGGPGIFWKAADGTGNAERLSVGNHVPSSVSPDDTQLLFSDVTDGHIGLLSLDGEPNPEVLLESQFRAQHVVVSPGGQWMAFAGDDTGMNEIYVRPFPDVESARWQVSTGGGTEPVWSPDGRELFYRMGAAVMSVPVSDGLPSTWGTPEVVFRGTYRLETVGLYSHYYDVSPDGDRFLMIQEAFSQGDGTVPDMIFVEHWFEELTQIVPRIDP